MSAATGGSFRRRAPARGAVVAGVAAALLLGTPGISPATASPAYAQVTNTSLVFQAQPSFDIVGAAGQPWQIRNMVTKEILQTGTVDATQTVTPDLTTIGSHRRRRRKHHRVSEHAVLSPVLRGPHHVCRNAGENHHGQDDDSRECQLGAAETEHHSPTGLPTGPVPGGMPSNGFPPL